MKKRFAIAACLAALLLFLAACAGVNLANQSMQSQGVLIAPQRYAFDVTKQGTTIDEVLRIPHLRYWFFQILLIFPYFSSTIYDEHERVCYGSKEAKIPISLQIYSIDDDGKENLIYASIAVTDKCYAHHWEKSLIKEVIYERNVACLLLNPGLYRFKTSVLQDNTAFHNFRSEFAVDYGPQM